MRKRKRKKKTNLPDTKTTLTERYQQGLKDLEDHKGEHDKIKFLFDLFGFDPSNDETFAEFDKNRNEDLKIIFFCKDEIRKVLLELSDKGADIVKIYNCIRPSRSMEHELEPLYMSGDAELHPDFNKMIDNAINGQKEFKKKVRALQGSVKLICGLKPIRMIAVDELRKNHPDLNERLANLQQELGEVINLYIKHTPYFSSKAERLSGYIASNWARPISEMYIPKKTTSKSALWNWRIITIVDELKRIGFSDRKAYIKTCDLLEIAFPDIWHGRNCDPDIIRQRYTYHKKRQK